MTFQVILPLQPHPQNKTKQTDPQGSLNSSRSACSPTPQNFLIICKSRLTRGNLKVKQDLQKSSRKFFLGSLLSPPPPALVPNDHSHFTVTNNTPPPKHNKSKTLAREGEHTHTHSSSHSCPKPTDTSGHHHFSLASSTPGAEG